MIVGAGAAGCVLANRLTESGRNEVTVIEAGGSDRRLFIKIPAGFRMTVGDPSLNWGYHTAPGGNVDQRRIEFPRGRVIGGSSSINGHLYVRGQAADYQQWAQLGCRGWSYDDVLPYFMKAETRPGGDATYRGHQGPLRISDQRELHPLSEAFFTAASATGLQPNPDYNSGDQEGTCLYQQMMRNGRRWSAADAYLRPALKRDGLRLISKAQVEAIQFEGLRAVGVTYRVGQEQRFASARKAVILAAGAINSPQLLQISGVGNAVHLQEIGVPVIHHLPGVGEGMRDHYATRLSYRVHGAQTLNERARGLPLVAEVLRYLVTRRGLLAMSPAHAGAFLRTRPELATPDIQLFVSPASFEGGRSGQDPLEKLPGMTGGCSQLRPESRGWVRATSADPTVAPEIQPNYLEDPIDQRTIIGGMRAVRQIFATSPLAGFCEIETLPGTAVEDDDDLLAYARATGSTIYHPIGSCKMGIDPMAVVDHRLKVAGIEGLRVVDASIMPTMPSGNTYAATIMVAEKGADMIREDDA
ncbi:MAG: GMC family oxidoreductase N-terminal domain-containing protein [Pseudomonadota bacterium]